MVSQVVQRRYCDITLSKFPFFPLNSRLDTTVQKLTFSVSFSKERQGRRLCQTTHATLFWTQSSDHLLSSNASKLSIQSTQPYPNS